MDPERSSGPTAVPMRIAQGLKDYPSLSLPEVQAIRRPEL